MTLLAVKRIASYMIDFLLLAMTLSGLQFFINFLFGGWPFDHFKSGSQIELWVLLTMSGPAWAYFIMYEWRRQQTIGKRLFRLRVVRNDGRGITLWQACLRTFIKLLPWEITHLIVLIPVPWWETGAEPNHLIYVPNALILIYIICLFLTNGKKGPHDFITATHISGKNESLQRFSSL